MAMASITPFPNITLTFQAERWLHNEAWSDVYSAYFAKGRQRNSSNILLPPTYAKAQASPGVIGGRWLLDQRDNSLGPRAWAEAQQFAGSFQCVWILFAFGEGGHGPTDALALAMLVSAAFIVGKADLIRLVDVGDLDSCRADLKTWGDVRQLQAFGPELSWLTAERDPMRAWSLIEISCESWWKLELGARCRGELSYLAKRLEREKSKEKCSNKTRKRGLLERLVRPKV